MAGSEVNRGLRELCTHALVINATEISYQSADYLHLLVFNMSENSFKSVTDYLF